MRALVGLNITSSEMLQMDSSSHVATKSFGGALLCIIGTVLLVLLCACCCCFRVASSTLSSLSGGKPESEASPTGAGRRREPEFSQSQVVAIPILCQQYVVPSSVSDFSVDMNEVMDPGRSSFAISSASGTKLLEAFAVFVRHHVSNTFQRFCSTKQPKPSLWTCRQASLRVGCFRSLQWTARIPKHPDCQSFLLDDFFFGLRQ